MNLQETHRGSNFLWVILYERENWEDLLKRGRSLAED
jgi:hypothetical protein